MLNARQQSILFQVIRSYVSSGEPVSSSHIARSGVVDVSSATIRNVMGDLEAQGLLRQPHTSAGRIPTPGGLRLFIDTLSVEGLPAGDPALVHIQGELDAMEGKDMEQAAHTVGSLLSDLVRLTSIVSTPSLGSIRLEDIHLSPLSERRVLAILVASDARVYHQVVPMTQEVDRTQLKRMQGYLSELAIGLTLEEVRTKVRREMLALARQANELVRLALEIGAQAIESTQPKVVVEGKFNVFDYDELTADTERLKHLLELLEEKEQVLELLDGFDEGQRPAVLLGPELDLGLGLGDEVSLIVCGYGQQDEASGLLGVIGPSRVDYERILPLIHQTALALSTYLGNQNK
jgi:heat-inducible transcriptional repressor